MRRLIILVMVTLALGLATQASSKPDDPGRRKRTIPEADFRKPITVATTFLAAALARSPLRLREVTAHDAATMADPMNRPLFAAILNQTMTNADLTRLATELEGYKVQPLVLIATGVVKVPMTKPGPDHSHWRRLVRLRVKKNIGWKVFDFSAPSLQMDRRS